ncbi:MAG: hypothetical protein QG566_552 [Patescibacteria group bacterium]|jgi:hypothetical protein|nr:hypothetical protein [Patescibacteria group bacterium]
MSTHSDSHGGHDDHKPKESIWQSPIGIGLAIVGVILLIVIFRVLYPSSPTNGENSTNSKKEKISGAAYSYTMHVEFSTAYGKAYYPPAGYDFSFVNPTGEYCAKNIDGESCGVGDLSGQLSVGSVNTKGLWFKGEQAGSLDILLVKNNNL